MTIGGLKILGLITLYEVACKNAVIVGGREDDLIKLEKLELIYAFSWEKSIEGHDFWKGLSSMELYQPNVIAEIKNHVNRFEFAHLSVMKPSYTDGVLVKRNGLFG